MAVLEELKAFVGEERVRLALRDNNVLGQSMSQIGQYREFLGIILDRYGEASTAFVENTRAMQKAAKDHSADAGSLHDEAVVLKTKLHLEIESFYLFAKILLDKMARSIEYYFGPERGLPLDSHDDLAKRLVDYAAAKQLDVTEDFVSKSNSWKERVSDYRDYHIAHEKSSRTLRATAFDAEGQTSMVLVRLYPLGGDRQVESEPLENLLPELDQYIQNLVEFLKANRGKTNLEILKLSPEGAAEAQGTA